MNTILVVDDEETLCSFYSDSLTQGYRVITAYNGWKALQLTREENPDLILLDIKMPGMDGIEVLKKIKKLREEIVVIMLTGYGTLETAREAMKLGAYDYVTKPVDLFLLRSLVNEALGRLNKPH